MRLERARIKRANETEEERFARIERVKMAKLKRLVMETEEERSKRLERQRTAQKRRYWRLRLLRASKSQQAPPQQTELTNSVTESSEEDQNVHTGTLRHIFHLKFDSLNSLFSEEFILPSESPMQTYTASIGAEINKETNFDVVCNLIHSISRKLNSHQQLNIFAKLCQSPSSNYILSAVAWHKLNNRTLTPELPLQKEAPQHQIDKDLNAKNCRSKVKDTRRSYRMRIQRAAETEEERSMRLERRRMKLAAETAEERSIRLERMRSRKKLRYWRKKCLIEDC